LVSTSSLRHWPDGALERLLAAGAHVVTWGNAYGMALAATGRVDAFFDNGVKAWDLGPAPVLMAEAGGRFGALDGSTAIDRGNGLCASAELFEPLRRLLAGD
jgi:fructose-1,6-bisphosphatase/inositol monophosphatase family enzyme